MLIPPLSSRTDSAVGGPLRGTVVAPEGRERAILTCCRDFDRRLSQRHRSTGRMPGWRSRNSHQSKATPPTTGPEVRQISRQSAFIATEISTQHPTPATKVTQVANQATACPFDDVSGDGIADFPHGQESENRTDDFTRSQKNMQIRWLGGNCLPEHRNPRGPEGFVL